MSNFYITKDICIRHGDGWGFKVSADGDEQVIGIAYQELVEGKLDGNLAWEDIDTIGGLWKESAEMLARALIEVSELGA